MNTKVLLATLMMSASVSSTAGILTNPIAFANDAMVEGMELKSSFMNKIRKYTSPGRVILMVNTDGKNKESYTARIEDGRLIINSKDEDSKDGFRTFSYETSLPDDVNGDTINLSFNDDILIVEI